MSKTPLDDYQRAHGQSATARAVGVTQGAIWQMLKSKREIYVVEHDDGTVELQEIKILARKSAA